MNKTLPLELTSSSQMPTPFEKVAADTLLADLDQKFNIGRAAVVVGKSDGWALAGSTRVDYDDFWQDAPISLSVLNDAFIRGKDIAIIDADQNQTLESRDSIFLGGMLNIACVGNSDQPGSSTVLLYVDNQVDNWAIRESDLGVLKSLVKRHIPEWAIE